MLGTDDGPSVPSKGNSQLIRRGGKRTASRRGRFSAERPTWLVIPAVVLLIAIIVVPALLDGYLSFENVTLTTLQEWLHAPWAGIENYIQAATSSNAIENSAAQALWVSISFSVLTTFITVPVGVMVALSVNHRFKGRSVCRSIFLVPYVIPAFVTAFVARLMFLNGTGLVDRVLSALRIAPANTYWLLGPHAFWAMLATEVWATWPFVYIMVLAGLSVIPSELYEAVELDGGGYLAKLQYVVLPQTKGVLLLAMLLATIFHLGNFTLPYVMFGSTPPSGVQVLPIDIYFRAFSTFQYSLASATAVLMLIVLAIPGIIYLRMTKLTTESDR